MLLNCVWAMLMEDVVLRSVTFRKSRKKRIGLMNRQQLKQEAPEKCLV